MTVQNKNNHGKTKIKLLTTKNSCEYGDKEREYERNKEDNYIISLLKEKPQHIMINSEGDKRKLLF